MTLKTPTVIEILIPQKQKRVLKLGFNISVEKYKFLDYSKFLRAKNCIFVVFPGPYILFNSNLYFYPSNYNIPLVQMEKSQDKNSPGGKGLKICLTLFSPKLTSFRRSLGKSGMI